MIHKSTILEAEVAEKALQDAVIREVEKKAKLGQDVVITENGVMITMKAEEALKRYKERLKSN